LKKKTTLKKKTSSKPRTKKKVSVKKPKGRKTSVKPKAKTKKITGAKKTGRSSASKRKTALSITKSKTPKKVKAVKPKSSKTETKPKIPVIKKAPIKKAEHKIPKVKKYKKNKKTRYTAKELKHFKEIILKEIKTILESAKANMRSLVDSESGEYVGDNLTYSTHMAEQGTDEMEREKNYMFVQRDEKYLGYLQDALTRIDQGIYGVCRECLDEPKNLCKTCPLIPKERLELVPITQHCIECKNLIG
jgi:RNA polymerase-binding transcription factor DksA